MQALPENWKGCRVVVTGASGFLGTHLVRSLADEGAVVHALVRSPHSHVDDQVDGETVHAVDVTDANALTRALGDIRPSVVFHFAAYGTHPDQSDRDVMERINVGGTLNLLEACRITGGPVVVYPSSCSEKALGTSTDFDQRMLYSATKVAASGICRAYHREGIVRCVIARLFTAYGPGEAGHRLIPTVARSLLRDEPPQVTSGDQKRDFVYVDDLMGGLMSAALTREAIGQTLELGTGHAVTVRKVVETLVRISGKTVQPEYGAVEKRSDDTATLQSDTGLAESICGWRASTSLEQGLSKTWAWYERQFHADEQALTSYNAR